MFSLLAVCLGACAGASLRWLFNLALNPLFPAMPLGTLAVNWLGSLLMGAIMAMIVNYPHLSQNLRLFLITGFLGSFTTFSAFAGETGLLILQNKYLLCAITICLHVFGSLGMLFMGMAAFNFLKKLCAG